MTQASVERRPRADDRRRRERSSRARASTGCRCCRSLANRTRFVGRDILLETPQYSAIRTPRYVYIEHAERRRELYDLVADPNELASRHADSGASEIRTELARRLASLRRCSGASCRVGPRLALRVTCSRRTMRARVLGADTTRILRTDFRFGSRRGSDRARPVRRGLPRHPGHRARDRLPHRRPRPLARRLRPLPLGGVSRGARRQAPMERMPRPWRPSSRSTRSRAGSAASSRSTASPSRCAPARSSA